MGWYTKPHAAECLATIINNITKEVASMGIDLGTVIWISLYNDAKLLNFTIQLNIKMTQFVKILSITISYVYLFYSWFIKI